MASENDELEFPPAHPGAYLREDIFPALNLTTKDLAKHLGVTRAALSDLMHEKRSVSIEMAQRLGKAFGNCTRFWLALQLQHDLWQREQNSRTKVQPINWRENRAA